MKQTSTTVINFPTAMYGTSNLCDLRTSSSHPLIIAKCKKKNSTGQGCERNLSIDPPKKTF